VTNPLCPLCSIELETSCHSIWSCPSAVAVWQDANRKVQKLSTAANEGWELVEELWGKLEEDEFVEAMTIARFLWLRRNKWVFDGQFSPPAQVLKQAREALDSFAITHTPSTQEDLVPIRGMAKWIKPIHGEVKCNWDAAINSKKKCMGVGVVARDDRGRVVAAKARFFPGIVNPTVAESMGAWQAVVMCCDMRFPQVVFEGDSLNVVSAHNNEDPCWSFGQIIEDIKAKIQDIPSVRVQHVPREANNVAHSLAKVAVSQMLDKFWIEECPSSIRVVYLLSKRTSFKMIFIISQKTKTKKYMICLFFFFTGLSRQGWSQGGQETCPPNPQNFPFVLVDFS
jgi:hypothetical protein